MLRSTTNQKAHTMIHTKHTPGPWEALTLSGITEISVGNTSPADKRHALKQWICSMNHLCGWVSMEEVEANAQLISTAPELLDALMELEVTATKLLAGVYNNDMAEGHKQLGETTKKARAAINKATGA